MPTPHTRRHFLTTGLALGTTIHSLRADNDSPMSKPLIVSTWPFGKPGNDKALETLNNKGSLLDAVEQGIRLVESDEKNRSVGINGLPNAAGVVQQDSCIMNGPGHDAGSVAAIEGILHPISAARRVMEKTPHVMLVGDGARNFALREGLESIEVDSQKLHKQWHKKQTPPPSSKHPKDNHDTVALLVLDADGNIAGGCSTSGWGGKLPGRVGDSPIIGSGLYVDNEVGAAGATGLGENVMRYCASFMVVEYMRQGLHPEAACLKTIARIAATDPKSAEDLHLNFVALDKKGRFGAAGTGAGFQYAVTTQDSSRVLTGASFTKKDIGPEGGNTK
ncbi:MAG: N4-(beta-N-acetylglucosaminyl)-L-asparaginase [Akkermansiaceae bacterium]|jgi:N4-(beta-N-acetylglucosaminyl)-L-asparaginase